MSISRRTDWAIDTEGRGIAGASVTVKDASTGALAVLYADVDGETPLSNPVKTDATGKYTYCAEADIYNEYISRPGYDNLTILDVTVGLVPGPTGPSGAPVTSSVTPLVSAGDGVIGTSTASARADHAHPEQTVWTKVQTFNNAVAFNYQVLMNGTLTVMGEATFNGYAIFQDSIQFTTNSYIFAVTTTHFAINTSNPTSSAEATFDQDVSGVRSKTAITSDDILLNATKQGFFGSTPVLKPSIHGDVDGNEVIRAIVDALSSLGLATDDTIG